MFKKMDDLNPLKVNRILSGDRPLPPLGRGFRPASAGKSVHLHGLIHLMSNVFDPLQ